MRVKKCSRKFQDAYGIYVILRMIQMRNKAAIKTRSYEANRNAGEEVQSRNTNRQDNWNASGIVKTGRGRRRTSPFSCYVNCITKRPLDISVARKKSNYASRRTARFLPVATTRPLNIHILAGVNFKILMNVELFLYRVARPTETSSPT